MSGRIEARAEPVKIPAEIAQDCSAPTVPLRDPALGIIVAIVVSALIWPAILIIWLYVLR